MSEPSQKPVVLMIDDEEEFVDTTARLLRRRGFEVITAGSGQEGVSVLGQQPVDVVVLDLKMPGMDGDEVLDVMSAKGYRQPVVILTGHGSVDHALDMGRAGVTGYLAKPCTTDELERKLRKALESVARDNHRRHHHGDTISVLLVDDETELLESLTRVLKTRGMRVHTAGTGEEGLALLDQVDVDVVVLDIKMPGMDGLEVLREINQGPWDCEVILLTGAPRAESALRSLRLGSVQQQLGAAAYLSKPPDVPRLVEEIRQAAARRRELREE